MTSDRAALNAFTEGDKRIETHARACTTGGCQMACRCWCHGITLHPNGERRADV